MGLHPVSEANTSSPFGSLSAAEFYSRHSVTHSSAFVTNPNGLKLFTQWWTPLNRPPLGLIAVVHGFTGESSWFLQLTSVLFDKSGFLTCAIYHQGHGFSRFQSPLKKNERNRRQSKVSMADWMMMLLVHEVMDKAYDQIKTWRSNQYTCSLEL